MHLAGFIVHEFIAADIGTPASSIKILSPLLIFKVEPASPPVLVKCALPSG